MREDRPLGVNRRIVGIYEDNKAMPAPPADGQAAVRVGPAHQLGAKTADETALGGGDLQDLHHQGGQGFGIGGAEEETLNGPWPDRLHLN